MSSEELAENLRKDLEGVKDELGIKVSYDRCRIADFFHNFADLVGKISEDDWDNIPDNVNEGLCKLAEMCSELAREVIKPALKSLQGVDVETDLMRPRS